MLYKLKSFLKNNLDLKGYELILFQIIFIFIFQIGSYSIPFIKYKYILVFNTFFIIGLIMFVVLLIYYIYRMIKTNRYINLWILICYIIISIIDVIILHYTFNEHYFLYLFVFCFGFIVFYIFLLIINLITYFIRNYKKISNVNDKTYPNKKIVFILLFIPIVYAIFGNIYHIYSLKQDEIYSEKIGKEYLEKKYNDIFKFKDIKIDGGYDIFGNGEKKHYLISYIIDNKTIIVKINIYTREIISDNYLESYLSDFINKSEKEYSYSLESELIYNYINLIENEINDKNISLHFSDTEVKLDKIDTTHIKKIKSISDLKEYIVLKKPVIYLNNDFSNMSVEEINNYILSIYKLMDGKYYKEDENIMKFKFEYNNSIAKTSYYKDGGYIKELNDKYLIYLNANPIEVEK